ncbi:MAG: HAD-IIA family hydrolase [Clostridiales Family XIII bacterium]|jgi:phosphoglycolate/pyridoxal phosphate phosphatase family enzyme|nr:HAD-IIA family hydrolase [Clostridiales Family XIII bacterium]
MDKRALLENIKLFVLDMDGTFYLGERILPGSLRFISRVRETGRRFLFFTNNSSKTPALYIEKLARMGLAVSREDIVTSGDVAIDYLNRRHRGASVYLMGTEALQKDFADAGLRLVPGEGADGDPRGRPDVVVCAFDTELAYAKLERACTYIRNGAVFLATHEDINCPTEAGFIPDCGAFCAAIELSAGRSPKYLGKPNAETADKLLALAGVPREALAFVGDRLYTDVAAGVNNGMAGFLVLSGETKAEDAASSDIKPDAVFRDLGEIADLL